MNAKIYFSRLAVGLTALFLGLGVYFVWQKVSAQTVSPVPEMIKPVAEASPVFVPLPPSAEAVDSTSETSENEEETDYEFYPDGNYYTFEELPKAFENIEELTIEANDWSEDENGDYTAKPILAKGSLTSDTEYKFAKISINNRLISFETEKINGISYTFVGEFPTISANEQADLKGTLKKFKNGKQIAKAKVNFAVSGC